MKILNLYAGIGGNRKQWPGYAEVTAIEKNPGIAKVYKDQFPSDTVIIGDAHDYLLQHHSDFDFVWSSPPCQKHSRMVKFTRHNTTGYVDMTLYQEIIFLQHFFCGKWVVENVVPYYEPLIKAQKIGRHLFWANFHIPHFEMESPKGFTKLSTNEGKKVMMDWLGIHFEKNIYYEGNHCPVQILRNAVHPLIGLHVLNAATVTEPTQIKLFA